MPKRQKKSVTILKKPLTLFGIFFALVLGGYAIFTQLSQPSGINLITNDKFQDGRLTYDENGCYSRQVKCFTAPCEPILVCPDGISPPPSKEPEVCTQEAGACIGLKGECATYTDGCIKSRLCAQPYQACRPTPTPTPTPSPTPTSTCMPRPACMDANPACMFKLEEGTVFCSPAPTPTSVKISHFQAANPCGEAHFYNYQVTCYNGVEKDLSVGRCLPISIALDNATTTCN